MNTNNLFVAIFISCFFSCNKKNDLCSSLPVKEACQKIYEVVVDGSPKAMKYLKKKNFEKIKFINGSFSIDPDRDFNINTFVLKKKLTQYFPDKSDCGIILYDWEGEAFTKLASSKKGSADFKIVEGAFIKAIKIGKAYRPNVKFGYYATPFRKYWNRDEGWRVNNQKLEKLFKEVDILFPSVYDFYCDSDLKNPEADYKYIEDNVKLALEFADKYDKAVIPLVWHRYHSSNKTRSLETIDPTEFKKHVSKALTTEYNGKRVEGVAWWSADRYYHKTKVKSVMKQQASHRSFDQYYNGVISTYGKILSDLIIDNCKN